MLKLPANFKNDIQGKDTALVPVISISPKTPLSPEDFIYLSTNNITLDFAHGLTGSVHCKPLLLNIPSLKESIDIEKRNYKISSINIDISNFPYNGARFSELAGDTSLINYKCRVFWVSPSVGGIAWQDLISGIDPSDNWAFQVFNGSIRRYTHDDEKVRLVVEDRSQVTLHKDLPLEKNYLGTGEDIPDKYKGKPKPMVYGHVDRSPCVIKTRMEEGDSAKTLEIISDSRSIDGYVNDDKWYNIYNQDTNSLWNFRDDTFFNVKRDAQGQYSYKSHYDSPNYIEDATNGTILLEPKYLDDGRARNAIGDDILETDIIRIPQAFNIAGETYSFWENHDARNVINHTIDPAIFLRNSNDGGNIDDFYFTPLIMLPIWRSLSEDDVALVRHFSIHNIASNVIESNENPAGYAHFLVLYDYDYSELGERVFNLPQVTSYGVEGYPVQSNNMHNIIYSGSLSEVENKSITDYEIGDSTDNGYNSGYWSKYSLTPPSFLKI